MKTLDNAVHLVLDRIADKLPARDAVRLAVTVQPLQKSPGSIPVPDAGRR